MTTVQRDRSDRANRLWSLRSDLVSCWTWCVASIGLSAVFFVIALYLHQRTGVEYGFLYRDANAIAGNPFYYGILESLTAILMISSGSILIFTIMTERWMSSAIFWFCVTMGSLSTLMGLDDLLMFHESAGFVHWRLEEVHVYGFYLILLLLATCYHWRVFISTPFPLLAIALAALAVAGIEDQLELGLIYEDYLEIIGFSFWFSYNIATSVLLKKRTKFMA